MLNSGLFLLAFSMGAILAIYVPVLSQTGRLVGSPILANVPFFFVGMLTSFVLALVMGHRPQDFGRLQEVPPWMFLAGVASGLMVLGSTFLIPKIGPGPFFVLIVAGQIVVGTALSQFGLLGSPLNPVTLWRGVGIALVLVGAWFVAMR